MQPKLHGMQTWALARHARGTGTLPSLCTMQQPSRNSCNNCTWPRQTWSHRNWDQSHLVDQLLFSKPIARFPTTPDCDQLEHRPAPRPRWAAASTDRKWWHLWIDNHLWMKRQVRTRHPQSCNVQPLPPSSMGSVARQQPGNFVTCLGAI